MKRFLPVVVAALLPLMVFSQEGAKQIVDELNGKRVIELNGGMKLEDLEAVLGKHDRVQSGDSSAAWYVWKESDKDIATALFRESRLAILILRNERYSYLGLTQANTVDDAIGKLGPLKSDNPGGALNVAWFEAVNLRIDYRRDTRRIFSIFLYF